MRLIRLQLLVLSLVGSLGTSFSQYKVECTCDNYPSPRDAFLRAGTVFSGRVQSMSVDTSLGLFSLKVTLVAMHTWKGAISSVVLLYSPLGGPTCGVDFHLDSAYLVYAYHYGDTLATNICTRTRLRASGGNGLPRRCLQCRTARSG
jgi:hypothetical protein